MAPADTRANPTSGSGFMHTINATTMLRSLGRTVYIVPESTLLELIDDPFTQPQIQASTAKCCFHKLSSLVTDVFPGSVDSCKALTKRLFKLFVARDRKVKFCRNLSCVFRDS